MKQTMKDVYCPLSIVGGQPMRCLDFEDGATCCNCPTESLNRLADSTAHLVSMLYNTEGIDVPGLRVLADALEGVADVLAERRG